MDYCADEIEKVDERRRCILEGLVKRLNAQACAGWCGQQDAHTLHIWHESLNLLDSDFVSLQVPKQSWRKTQYFLFQPADCSAPLHIYHSHRPSFEKTKGQHERQDTFRRRAETNSRDRLPARTTTPPSTSPSRCCTTRFPSSPGDWRFQHSDLAVEMVSPGPFT